MNKGYANGSDLLITLGGLACGHSTSHKIQYKTDTQKVAVKAPVTDKSSGGMFQDLQPTGQDITIQVQGLKHYEEMEGTLEMIRTAWYRHEPVEVEAFMREDADNPYLVAKFLITDLSESGDANQNMSYDLTLSISGAPTLFNETELKAA